MDAADLLCACLSLPGAKQKSGKPLLQAKKMDGGDARIEFAAACACGARGLSHPILEADHWSGLARIMPLSVNQPQVERRPNTLPKMSNRYTRTHRLINNTLVPFPSTPLAPSTVTTPHRLHPPLTQTFESFALRRNIYQEARIQQRTQQRCISSCCYLVQVCPALAPLR